MSLEFNKIAAAILMAGIIAMFSGFIARELFHVEPLLENAYKIEGVGESTGPSGTPEAPTLEPILPLLAEADAANGEKLFKACATCHTIDDGGPNKIGPNLWNIVNRDVASHEGFQYSDAMSAVGGKWDYEHLNKFIAHPRDTVPGTKMTYPGMKKVGDRADLVAYLRNQSGSPAPLPTQDEIDAVIKAAAPAEEGSGSAEANGGGEQQATDQGGESGSPEGGDQGTSSGGEPGIKEMIAAADPARGEKVSKQCMACHTFDAGGPNKVGPNLYGVIGAPMAHLDSYNYSKAFQEAHEAGRVWTYEDLAAYLANPKAFLPGNKMTFAGLKKQDDVAAIIAYLRQQHDNPPPLD